ncbi:MAG: AAA family ATPase [Chloroflexi bacterium]|nr:AAA family ATPase [Chloroflexota bacterium]
MNSAKTETLYRLRETISNWAFYSTYGLQSDKIRRSVLIEQTPKLNEDAGNLSAVLFFLMTEHRRAFDEIQDLLRQIVPAFTGLTVKARGGPGEIMAFWREGDQELTLADVSDGILRLLCWMVLCVMPNPPSLICIDEPDQGVHPRTLPILAGLFRRASQRTQILLATHNSYFLTQFDFGEIAVMRKKDRNIEFLKPAHSQVLIDMLADFGSQELEHLHRSDELELLP